MAQPAETPQEKESRTFLQQYLEEGETLLVFTSTERMFVSQKPIIALTDCRVILVGTNNQASNRGVFYLDRSIVQDIRWAGAWARLHITTKTGQHYEFEIFGDVWKRHADELAKMWKQPVAPNPVSAKLTTGVSTSKSQNLAELEINTAQPRQFWLDAKHRQSQGGEEAVIAIIRRTKDLSALGLVGHADRFVNQIMGLDQTIATNPEVQKVHKETRDEFLSLRFTAIFLFSFVLITLIIFALTIPRVGLEQAYNDLFLGEGALALFYLIFGINFWKGKSKLKKWMLILGGIGFLGYGLGGLSGVDLFVLITETAFYSAIFLGLLGKKKVTTILSTIIFAAGYLLPTAALILLSLLA